VIIEDRTHNKQQTKHIKRRNANIYICKQTFTSYMLEDVRNLGYVILQLKIRFCHFHCRKESTGELLIFFYSGRNYMHKSETQMLILFI
jgi:hypothetical protein